MVTNRIDHKWGMVVDLDKCTGCQACVVACQAENNLPINTKDFFLQKRAYEWIRIERYWEGEYPNVKARFIPVLCQHCENAPCEPVCPVYATYRNDDGLNVQIYNRCVGTRYCINNCPYQVRFFNFWQPNWPERLKNQLNPDVTIRTRGITEKCTFCVQRLRRAELQVERVSGERLNDEKLKAGNYAPACTQACPTNALMFGDQNDAESKIRPYFDDVNTFDIHHEEERTTRGYRLLEEINTRPSIIYLKKVDQYPLNEDEDHV
ncbi:MAG: 4Fe-4S dicluster domain-containing protein [Chloroflexi bacterium]|nr:4Fe-4S dicluster domain-containing protein [Chloroflexota bacterium]MDA1218726.1 4Fe-4S dicluster domain-containing protein [Chloroflexota bacterium]PKB58023.1 MAG: 4Fe-4S ferredoxin [SAR202 cluster bacterium Casp-Chloro-G3]